MANVEVCLSTHCEGLLTLRRMSHACTVFQKSTKVANWS